MWLSHLVDNASAHLLREQKKYQKRFNKKVRLNKDGLQIGSFVFLRRGNVQRREATHRLELIVDDPNEVTSMGDTIAAVKIGTKIERVSRNRVVTFFESETGTTYIVNNSASHHGNTAHVLPPRNPNQLVWNHSMSPHRSMLS